MNNENGLMSRYKTWASKNNQSGKYAFSRFMMISFLEALTEVSRDFVFKGGNLLWHYIKTPRSTTDLDLSTITAKNHEEVKRDLEKALTFYSDITYEIGEFNEVSQKGEIGAKVLVKYKTDAGQQNSFNVDIVYAIPVDIALVKSTLSERKYQAATLENIIFDKLDAAFRYGGGNTRMKDYDDLYRIIKSGSSFDKKRVRFLLEESGRELELKNEWGEYLRSKWQSYLKGQKQKDLPKDIGELMEEINSWLATFKEDK